VTLVSGDIRFIRIFTEVPWGGGVKRCGVVDNSHFQRFAGYFSETLEMRRALLYSNAQSVISFSVIPNCMTLNDRDWLFRVKFCFRAGLAGSDCATFEK